MTFINVGASLNGARIASKAAFKRAVKETPEAVEFDSTSPMGTQFDGGPSDLTAGVKLSVVGPDPYTNRRWYATVERTNAGTIKVS